jgi:flagellar hook assembly protein FlgD
VRVLVDGARAAGANTARWDGSDERGRPVAAGVYVARIVSAGTMSARAVTLVR